jgi:hypothetical protein
MKVLISLAFNMNGSLTRETASSIHLKKGVLHKDNVLHTLKA